MIAHLSEFDHGEHRITCFACGRGPRDKNLGLRVDHEGAIWHCFRCGESGSTKIDAPTRRPARPAPRPARLQRRETLSEWGRDLWSACRPLSGAAVSYFEARACVIPPSDGDLRFHPELRHPGGHVGPALVGLVTNARTREPMTLHRTWIRPDGRKAACEPSRMLLGGHRKAGGVIRLWPDEAVTIGVGVAEGIETALSLAHAFAPVWSVIDAGNLAAFPVLDGIEALLIGVDHDDAGINAASECATRWAFAGREVVTVMPPCDKSDLNDLAREAA